jgi:hypothetical protein
MKMNERERSFLRIVPMIENEWIWLKKNKIKWKWMIWNETERFGMNMNELEWNMWMKSEC